MLKRFLKENDFLRLSDLLLMFYLVLISLSLLFFHRGLELWWKNVVGYLIAAVCVFMFLKLTEFSQLKITRLIRDWYVFPVIIVLYRETGRILHSIFTEWFDSIIYSMEYRVLGFHPIVLLQKTAAPFTTEAFKFIIFSAFVLIFVSALILYLKKNINAFSDYLETISIGAYVSFVIFILFPIKGPQSELAHLYAQPLVGYFFTHIMNIIDKIFSISGGGIPSVLLITIFISLRIMRKYEEKLYYVLLPITILICVALIYCRQQYLTSVLASILIAWFALYVRHIINENFTKLRYI
ncbi:MAG: hypothetical protein ABH857_03030 [Elusimicrobiota bacterium]